MFELDPRRRAIVAPALTAVLILLAEIAGHGIGNTQLGATFFLLALAPIAYAGLRAGLWNSLLCTALLALYAFHYTAPHDQIGTFGSEGWVAFAIMVTLGLGMGWPMSRVRAREARLHAALQQRATDLEDRNRELTNANASLEAFGYVVSHDLKEPVRALENYLDAARQEWPGDESRKYVDEAYEANRRLTRLLDGLLRYSRTSSLPATAEPVPLAELIRSEASTQYAPKLVERGAKVHVAPELPAVMGDRVILAQLFGNLILNAVRHHPQAATVMIRPGDEDGERAHIVVEDDGRGFPPDVLERFGKLHADRPATIKAGFGLAIAHRAAQRLGGRLWLENVSGGGARAHVELPAVDRVVSDEDG